MSEDAKKKKKKKPKILERPSEQQIDEVAVGMLREYMHKREFKNTLAIFDEEMPRSEVTIQSRQLMMDLLHYCGTTCESSIIEFVCKGRVTKLYQLKEIAELDIELQALQQEAKTLSEEVAPLKKTLKKLKKKTEQTMEKASKKQQTKTRKPSPAPVIDRSSSWKPPGIDSSGDSISDIGVGLKKGDSQIGSKGRNWAPPTVTTDKNSPYTSWAVNNTVRNSELSDIRKMIQEEVEFGREKVEQVTTHRQPLLIDKNSKSESGLRPGPLSIDKESVRYSSGVGDLKSPTEVRSPVENLLLAPSSSNMSSGLRKDTKRVSFA